MRIALLRILVAAALTACAATAQNSDLGLLLGVGVPVNSTVSPGLIKTSSVHGGGQINYAVQLHETVAGRLYLELPLVITGGARTRIVTGTVSTSSSDTVFFTPGLRWQFSPHNRVSFYAAAGGGVGSADRHFTEVGKGGVSIQNERRTSGAFDFGGGLDLRLTRLMSFRGEVRDEVMGSTVDGAVHHTLFMFGVGLHF